jgi:hypothetical protein
VRAWLGDADLSVFVMFCDGINLRNDNGMNLAAIAKEYYDR